MKWFYRILCFLALAVSAVHADETILAAQKKLKRLGYYEGGIDGENGSQTAAAIRRYQLAQNLKVNGELTPQTLNSLGLAAKPAPVSGKSSAPAPTSQPEWVALAAIFKGGPFISVGPEMQIAAIKQAQKNLKTLGYYHGPADGRPTPALVASLKAWQQSAGFRQTGRFDESTLKGLSLMPN